MAKELEVSEDTKVVSNPRTSPSSSATRRTTLHQTSLWANRKCLVICAVVAIANMQYGLDSAILAGLQAMPGFLRVFGHPDPKLRGGYGIDSTFQQLIGSFLTLGAFVSSVSCGLFGHYLGRKPGLWAACLLSCVGCAIQIGTESKAAVYVGRLTMGLGNGFLVTFSNIYCAEVAPAHLRAVMVALFSEWVTIGGIAGAAVSNSTSKKMDKSSYQIPLGVQFIVPAILAVGLFFVPETPRWLLNKGRAEEARKALEQLRADNKELSTEEFETEWVEMVNGIAEEKRMATSTAWLDMFKGPNLRRTLLCWAVMSSPTAAGSWFLISYSTYFFVVSGLSVEDAFKYNIMKSCFGLIGVNVGMYLMRHRFGRRTMMISGCILQGLCLLGMGITGTTSAGTALGRDSLVAFVCLFYFFFNGWVGDLSHPVATELVSTRLRSWTVGSAISLGYLEAWLAGFCSPYFINPDRLNWGAKYAYIWAGSNLVCAIFLFFYLPELKGRTLEEIDELFERRVPTWKFKSAKTTVTEEAIKEVQKRLVGGETVHVEANQMAVRGDDAKV